MLDPFTIVTVFLVLMGSQLIYNVLLSPIRKVPGPVLAALSPLYIKYFTFKSKKAFKIHELHKKYGPVIRIGPTEISVIDISTVRKIYSTKSKYLKSTWYLRLTGQTMPDLFAMVKPSDHRQRRSLLAHGFSATALTSMEPLIAAKVKMAVEKIRRDACEKKIPTDILKWWTFMATDIIGELTFGECFHTLEKEEESTYVQIIQKIGVIGNIRSEIPIPMFIIDFFGKILPPSKLKDIVTAHRKLHYHGSKAVVDFASSKVKISEGSEKPTILSKMMDAKDAETGVSLTMEEIEAQAAGMLVAGTDTMANTLTYLVWILLKNPDIHRRLYTEISTLSPNFTDADLRSLPYLAVVILETLRLYGAAQGNFPRVVPDEGAEVEGYQIPAGTIISTQSYSLHRDPKNFPDPLKFDPERWFSPTPEMNEAFLPFGGGSRACIGKSLAQMELRLAIAHFLLACPDVKLADSCTDDSMDMENFVLVMPKSHRCEIIS